MSPPLASDIQRALERLRRLLPLSREEILHDPSTQDPQRSLHPSLQLDQGKQATHLPKHQGVRKGQAT